MGRPARARIQRIAREITRVRAARVVSWAWTRSRARSPRAARARESLRSPPGARTPWSPCGAPYRGRPPRPSRGARVSWAALRADALACHAAALAAVEPGRLVAPSLAGAGGALRL